MGAVVDATLYFRELAEQEEQQILNTLAEQQIEILQLSADQRQTWQTEMQKTYPQLLENLDQQLIESIRAH